MRSYDRQYFEAAGLQTNWVQESLSFNRVANTIRGLHFQTPPLVETKVVRVLTGAVLDVLVDLRKGSDHYGTWDAIELSAEKGNAVYIPAGCAHGFRTLEADTLIEYKIDVPFDPALSDGIQWNDPSLNIDWNASDPITSERDNALPLLSSFVSPF
jgi:dTDP-4-dehydrorhamnose 3,5-epimerase